MERSSNGAALFVGGAHLLGRGLDVREVLPAAGFPGAGLAWGPGL